MSKQPFDPFDERWRDQRKRRPKHVVQAEREGKQQEMDDAVRKVLVAIREQRSTAYIQSSLILMMVQRFYRWPLVIQRCMPQIMRRLGYVKMQNEHCKGGRFRDEGKYYVVYRSVKHRPLSRKEYKMWTEDRLPETETELEKEAEKGV